MFDKINETALGVFNALIWRLYSTGEYRAATIIEKVRDIEAMKEYNKRDRAKTEREIIYNRVAKIYKEQNRFGLSHLQIIKKLEGEKSLGKIYYLLVKNFNTLKTITKTSDLYNRVGYLYLHTFHKFTQGDKIYKTDLYDFRRRLSTIERNLRHIKADHPELFSLQLVKNSKDDEAEMIESLGNHTPL